MFDENYIEVLTGLKTRTRLGLASYYAKLNESGKVDAHRRQVEVFRVWRTQGKTERTKDGENNYAALLVALKAMQKIEKTPVTSNANFEFKIERLKKDRRPKPQKMKDIIEKRYFTEITRLREQQLSWRQISAYLKKYFKKEVSHTYLKKVFEELKSENQQTDQS